MHIAVITGVDFNSGPWPVKIKEGQSVSPMTGLSGQLIFSHCISQRKCGLEVCVMYDAVFSYSI